MFGYSCGNRVGNLETPMRHELAKIADWCERTHIRRRKRSIQIRAVAFIARQVAGSRLIEQLRKRNES